MFNRKVLICLAATGVSSILLYMYFKNKMKNVEDKLDLLYQLIENHTENNSSNTPTSNNLSSNQSNIQSTNLIEVSDDEDELDEVDLELPEENVVLSTNLENNQESDDEDDDNEDDDNEEDDDEEDDDEEDDDEDDNDDEEEEEEYHAKVIENILDIQNIKTKNLELKDTDVKNNLDDLDSLSGIEDDLDNLEDNEEEEQEEDTIKNVSIEEEVIDYTKLKVKELKEIAKSKGYAYSKLKRNELIKLLSEN